MGQRVSDAEKEAKLERHPEVEERWKTRSNPNELLDIAPQGLVTLRLIIRESKTRTFATFMDYEFKDKLFGQVLEDMEALLEPCKEDDPGPMLTLIFADFFLYGAYIRL
ncbi:MAG: hypothetical protein AAFV80_18650 [Bacteroidota bacterium]